MSLSNASVPPSAESSTFGDLLDAVRAFVCEYVAFPQDEQATVIALWVAHTWVVDAFDFTPYLAITSPIKRCGKSRLMDSMRFLVRMPWYAIRPSAPVLFRKISTNCPTLLLDEVDTIFNSSKGDESREEVRAVLNGGFQKGATVPRCVGPKHNLAEFSVFCAKALAGIGALPDTVADRSLPIVLVRKSPGQEVLKFRQREVKPKALKINEALAAWSSDPNLLQILADARPDVPDDYNDRTADISEPLLALADLAGGEWPDAARIAISTLCRSGAADDENLPARLLMACREIFAGEQGTQIATKDLLTKLIEREDDAPWACWWEADVRRGNTRGPASRLARLLKPFGLFPRTIRIGDETHKGYTLESFIEVFACYLGPTESKKS